MASQCLNSLFPADPNEDETLAYAAQIVDSLSFSMVMQTAIELDLFEIIAKAGPGGKLSAEEIAGMLETNNPGAPTMLDRMLRLLTNFEVLNCKLVKEEKSGPCKRLYGLAPVSKYFVKDEDGVSLGPLMQMLQDKVFVESWYKLKDAILEGGVAFDKAHGVNAFEYPGKDKRFNEVFNKAMYNHTIIIMKNILRCYKGFENLKQLVDVGGGLGQTLQSIVTKYPHIKGINFDLPHVVEHAKRCPGVEHVGGDMFESVPTGDAIFMKWILHDWSDAYCLKLLKNCYRALPENGKVILVEAIVEEEPETTMVAKAISEMDLIMMTQNPGGKERTEKEFLALATAAGFSGIELKTYVCNFWVIEFYK